MKTSYITAEGERRLREELNRLWSHERPRITQEVAAAAALGDRSENAEYIYGKKKLREIDRRIQFLARRLDALTVVRETPKTTDKVYFGAWVQIESDEEQFSRWLRIVGPDEASSDARYISVESPMGKSLLRKQIDDEVEVVRPRGPVVVSIRDIRYEDPALDGVQRGP